MFELFFTYSPFKFSNLPLPAFNSIMLAIENPIVTNDITVLAIPKPTPIFSATFVILAYGLTVGVKKLKKVWAFEILE